MKNRLDILLSIVTILIASISILLQFFSKDSSIWALVILGIIIGVVIIWFIYDYIKDLLESKIKQISENTEKVKKIESYLNFKRDIHELDKKIEILRKEVENKMNKRGQINPRWIILIILILLFILYLRAQGII